MGIDQMEIFSELESLFCDPCNGELRLLENFFTTSSNELRKKIKEGTADMRIVKMYSGWEDSEWRYNPITGIRTTKKLYIDPDQGIEPEEQIDQDTFDDLVIRILKTEARKIINELTKIRFYATPNESLTNKYEYYRNQLFKVRDSFLAISFPGITENTKIQGEKLLNDIETLISQSLSPAPNKEKKPGKGEIETIRFHWINKNPRIIRQLYISLREAGFIKDKVDRSRDFLQIFSGNSLELPFNPIIWKNIQALKYFIDKLETIKLTAPAQEKGKKAFLLPENQWICIQKCFIRPDQKEMKFIRNATHDLSKKTAKKIDRILNDLNL